MAGLFALDRDTRIRQQSSPGAAKPPLAYLITGSFSYWWNGGGEDSVHSSVVAPSPPGLSATFFLRTSAYKLGRASCRERVCQSVSISVVAVHLQKKTQRARDR